jgi:hypothetical protein
MTNGTPAYIAKLVINVFAIAGDRVFSLILGRSSLRGFCLFSSECVVDYRQKNPLKYSISVSQARSVMRDSSAVLQFDDDGVFVALGELGTTKAVSPYLLGEARLVDFIKTQLLKKARMVGKGKYFLEA